MKKSIVSVVLFVIVLALCSCGATTQISADYGDAASFEAALNEGENLVGKTVSFTATDLRPQSAFGYNIIAGEHLNFVSPQNPDIAVGDTVTVKVTEVNSFFGSWIISYEKVNT